MMRAGVLAVAMLCVGCASSRSRPLSVSLPSPGRSASELRAQLQSSDPVARAAAAWELAGATDVDDATEGVLVGLLEDAHKDARYAAAWALAHVSTAGDYYQTPPKPLRMTKPVYPTPAFHDRIEGTVIVEILIGEEGEVAHSQIRASIPALDQAALACVRDWRFEPATRGGRAIAAVARAPVGFRMY